MHDTELYLGLRTDCFNGFREPLKPIDAGNQDVLYTSVFQLCHHL